MRSRSREGEERTEDGVDDFRGRSALYATETSSVYESVVDGGLLKKESNCSLKRRRVS